MDLITEFATELIEYCNQLEDLNLELKTSLLDQFQNLRSEVITLDSDTSSLDALIIKYVNDFTVLCPNINLVTKLRKIFLNDYIDKLNRRVVIFIRNDEITERLQEILAEMKTYYDRKLTKEDACYLKYLMVEFEQLDAEQKALVVESEQIRLELEAVINE